MEKREHEREKAVSGLQYQFIDFNKAHTYEAGTERKTSELMGVDKVRDYFQDGPHGEMAKEAMRKRFGFAKGKPIEVFLHLRGSEVRCLNLDPNSTQAHFAFTDSIRICP
jgi:hypothetical protein